MSAFKRKPKNYCVCDIAFTGKKHLFNATSDNSVPHLTKHTEIHNFLNMSHAKISAEVITPPKHFNNINKQLKLGKHKKHSPVISLHQ